MWATARSAGRGFQLPAEQLEAFPDTTIPGGTVIKAAYTSDGRGLIAWSGRTAVRAALVNGHSIRAPQDLAPIAPDETQNDRGLYDLAVSADGQAPGDDGGRGRHRAQPGARGAAGRRRVGLRADRDGVRAAAVPASARGRVRPDDGPGRGRVAGPAGRRRAQPR